MGGGATVIQYNKKNRTVSNAHLQEIFGDVGAGYGYKAVSAEFRDFADIKLRWERSYDWVRFELSDYFDRAPDDVLADLANQTFARIMGANASDHGEIYVSYVRSKEFRDGNREDYINRHATFTNATVGDYHCLDDSVNRLMSMGLIDPDMDCVLTWDSGNPVGRPDRRAVGYSSFMRTVWVNQGLDAGDVPEYVIDYCIFFAICNIVAYVSRSPDDKNLEKMLKQYPMKKDAEAWLKKNHYRVD